MASISPPTPHKLPFTTRNLPSVRKPLFHHLSRVPNSGSCRCTSGNSSSSDNPSSFNRRWDLAIQDALRDAIKRFDSYLNSYRKQGDESLSGGVAEVRQDEAKKKGEGEEAWDWERWKKHFEVIDDQERLVTVLKAQLSQAIYREDYDDAAKIKVAMAAAATSDTVGRVMSHLNRAVMEERYMDAAILRDKAGAGLVGWWAGNSKGSNDPYGLIIRITAEHGRYVARSYSPRQLATAVVGAPLFEIFLTINKKGEYKQKAVYLKRRGHFQDSSVMSSSTFGTSSRLMPPGTNGDKSDLLVVSTEDEEGDDTDDGVDLSEGLSGFQNILRDMIPGVKVKVLKVTAPGKVDRDLLSKVIEQIVDEESESESESEEDEDKDFEEEEEVMDDKIKGENDKEKDDIEIDSTLELSDSEETNEVSVKVVVGGLAQKLSGSMRAKKPLRLPAKFETKGRLSFSFTVEKDLNEEDTGGKEHTSVDTKTKLQSQRSMDNVMLDMAKFIGKEKIPLKVLKEVGELLTLTLSQAQNRQPLSGSTIFNRIEVTASPDPLNGLYIGAQGLYTSEVINLRRRFGQWKNDDGTKESSNLEFYEYVEAVKLTGDPFVPAGQVAFRAKVGKKYQLPHKGIIPEEFGVIARYKGQGRLSEPGLRTPRWVDGELVILDGKHIKGGPVVGFVYWAPEYHFLVFFNRLRLQP